MLKTRRAMKKALALQVFQLPGIQQDKQLEEGPSTDNELQQESLTDTESLADLESLTDVESPADLQELTDFEHLDSEFDQAQQAQWPPQPGSKLESELESELELAPEPAPEPEPKKVGDAEETEASLRMDLNGLRLKHLRQRARDAQIDPTEVEDALDTDDPKAAVITLLLDSHRRKIADDSGVRRDSSNMEQAHAANPESRTCSHGLTLAAVKNTVDEIVPEPEPEAAWEAAGKLQQELRQPPPLPTHRGRKSSPSFASGMVDPDGVNAGTTAELRQPPPLPAYRSRTSSPSFPSGMFAPVGVNTDTTAVLGDPPLPRTPRSEQRTSPRRNLAVWLEHNRKQSSDSENDTVKSSRTRGNRGKAHPAVLKKSNAAESKHLQRLQAARQRNTSLHSASIVPGKQMAKRGRTPQKQSPSKHRDDVSARIARRETPQSVDTNPKPKIPPVQVKQQNVTPTRAPERRVVVKRATPVSIRKKKEAASAPQVSQHLLSAEPESAILESVSKFLVTAAPDHYSDSSAARISAHRICAELNCKGLCALIRLPSLVYSSCSSVDKT